MRVALLKRLGLTKCSVTYTPEGGLLKSAMDGRVRCAESLRSKVYEQAFMAYPLFFVSRGWLLSLPLVRRRDRADGWRFWVLGIYKVHSSGRQWSWPGRLHVLRHSTIEDFAYMGWHLASRLRCYRRRSNGDVFESSCRDSRRRRKH